MGKKHVDTQNEDLNRERLILNIISERPVANQRELQMILASMGVALNQSSVSRLLKKLPIGKIEGVYRILPKSPENTTSLEFISAGRNLIIVHTEPGIANRAALLIDRAKLQHVAGTIAGDDTIFIAVTSTDHHTIQRQVTDLLGLP